MLTKADGSAIIKESFLLYFFYGALKWVEKKQL